MLQHPYWLLVPNLEPKVHTSYEVWRGSNRFANTQWNISTNLGGQILMPPMPTNYTTNVEQSLLICYPREDLFLYILFCHAVVKICHYVRIVRRNRRGSGLEGFSATRTTQASFKHKTSGRDKSLVYCKRKSILYHFKIVL